MQHERCYVPGGIAVEGDLRIHYFIEELVLSRWKDRSCRLPSELHVERVALQRHRKAAEALGRICPDVLLQLRRS
jgi:hypothetical protein